MKLSLVLPIVFSVLLAIVGGVLLLNRPPDASAQLGGPLEAALKSRGISVENLVVTGTDEGVEVSITTSAGGEPTALRTRTVIEKELAYLKSDGQTAAEWVTVVIRDETGAVLFGTRQPVEAAVRPTPAAVEPEKSDAVARFVASRAQERSVGMKDFLIVSEGSDMIVEVVLAVEAGDERDSQIEWIIPSLLGEIRDEVENVNGIKPAFYRLSIQDADTYEPLVEWVVDAQKVSVRGWTAESVDADLAMFPPSKIPEGNTTTTGTSEE